MDEGSATTVVFPYLLRGRWHNTATILHCTYMDVWETSKYIKLRNITKIVLLCFSPSLVCVCCGDLKY